MVNLIFCAVYVTNSDHDDFFNVNLSGKNKLSQDKFLP